MSNKIWAVIVVVVALVLALLASFWPQDRLADIIYVSRFFDVMLPILAVGALVKYLCQCKACYNCKCCTPSNKPL